RRRGSRAAGRRAAGSAKRPGGGRMRGPDAAATLDRLDALCRLGVISELDVAFARFAGRLAHSGASEVALAACLASAALAEGCVCADLARVAGTRPFRPSDDAAPA